MQGLKRRIVYVTAYEAIAILLSSMALALWMTRNAGNEYDDAEESERE